MTRFQKLAIATLGATYALVIVGALVRVTGSGMGCPDWPLCHGQVIPPIGDERAWIEWLHRTLAAAIGLLALGVVALALRDHRGRREIVWPAVAVLGVTAFQAVLGKITVDTGNDADAVTAHLATAMLLLALLTYLAIRVRYPGRWPAGPGATQRFTLLIAFCAAAVYALLLFGARVTGTPGASLAFPDWPLFDGSLLPRFATDPAIATQQAAHALHRVAAAIVGIVLAVTAWIAWGRTRRAGWAPEAGREVIGALASSAVALYAVQVVVGGLQILTRLAPWSTALHLALGSAIWALLVATATYAYCEARGAGAREQFGATGGERSADMAAAPDRTHEPRLADKLRAYIALTKPRIVELLLVTTVPAMVLAARGIPRLDLVAWTLLGGALAAGSANAINQYLERDIDRLMSRTRRRPLPAHQVEPESALLFGLALGVIAFTELAVLVNLLAASLALLAIAFYVVVYTIMLKRRTPQNIVIGGAAGSLPPVIGWAAVTGDVTLPALLLFAIVFHWTPPHFWALSMRLLGDYRAAGIPMLPVVRGVAATARQILLYSIVLVGLTLLFAVVAGMGALYLAGALALGGAFLYQAVAMWREGTERRAIALYRYSTTYLAALFLLIALDVLVPIRITGV
jgi:protoheme IX farnesyltransferase